MKISLIAALSENFVIGQDQKIPWYIPKDLSWFKHHTLNKSIIMGRKTWESLPGPLPMRNNIVISKKKICIKKITLVNSIQQAFLSIPKNHQEVMIIGGGTIYLQTIQYANKLYLTHIHKNIIGNIYFPQYNLYKWNRIFYQKHHSNNQNIFDYSFEILERHQ
ncbi:Dihydrofolate reductase [Buchnera aphidicola (Eriosoma grossulariae)]|uniref:type 3 dihydrofolate reductase n=1 Tax=Buchnera aphidicola TaxID=9 RepID=UPI0034647155